MPCLGLIPRPLHANSTLADDKIVAGEQGMMQWSYQSAYNARHQVAKGTEAGTMVELPGWYWYTRAR